MAEGGYVNHPNDPGGETNYGITKNVAMANGYYGPMRDLPRDYAWSIYYDQYVKNPGYEVLLAHSPAVVEELVDTGVNTGVSRSSTWFQKALNSLNRGGKDYPMVTVDGKVGKQAVAAYAALERKRGRVKACEMVIKLVDAQQAAHYMSLSKLSDFTPGWVDHRIGNVNLDKCKLPPE
ncbi:MAG: glycosyl hydrolase 108 family protein [Bacteroides thetaiotaomicron]